MKKAASLKYDEKSSNAPKLTAYGKGAIAHSIIDVAKQHNIPIKKDEDMLEMLSVIEVNEEIPTELYKAVAEVFSFIYGVSNEQGKSNNEE